MIECGECGSRDLVVEEGLCDEDPRVLHDLRICQQCGREERINADPPAEETT